ncbi:MAG TPA: serine dehydratase [Gammaproteobacteria bacterium]|nr:serine dehydratase [Gammaproteobacteria bacterium]
MVDINDVREARERISPYIHQTPILQSELLNEVAGAELFFKCENFQKVGAFKARGATNAVQLLSSEDLPRGVATHSSGNHGAALAWAASIRNTSACIVVPSNAKQVKKDAIAAYGAEIVECEPTLPARESALHQVVKETGANFVPPYDDERIIAGQGTVALEMLEQMENLDAALIPVGGGGLLAGCLLGFSGSSIETYGIEPEGADDAYRSVASGERIKAHSPDSICDGLLTTLGEGNFPIIRDRIADILLVSDQEVIDAMYLLWTRLKIVVEPSSAITLAGLLGNRDLFAGKRVGLVLTGGNVDLKNLPFDQLD